MDGQTHEQSFQQDPFSFLDVKYVPAFLLQIITEKFLMREPEKVYELQVEYKLKSITLVVLL